MYPNPATRTISVEFGAEQPGRARAQVLDLAGRSLKPLFDAEVVSGSVAVPATLDLPPGCYLIRLEVDGRVGVKKLVVE